MKEVTKIHHEAMKLAEEAFLAKQKAELGLWMKLTREAFNKEREAAELLNKRHEYEPTRSVLYRSAASLALDCGEIVEAEKLISAALLGQPPEEIANELRDLLEKVYFERHLKLRGIVLQPNEFQFSFWGELVGLGIAPSEEFIGRVKNIETLLYRTAERKRNKPYRDAGRRKKEIEQELGLYITIPRAASFAVSFRLGTQMQFAGIGFGEEVIDELLECVDLVDKANLEDLEKRIKDKAYYENFVALAKEIAPDGSNVKSVGFATFRRGEERHVVLSSTRSKIAKLAKEKIAKLEVAEEQTEVSEEVTVRGWLRLADSRKPDGLIDLVDENNIEHTINVPKGMMADIVRPMYEYEVIVTGYKKGDLIILGDIEKVSD